MIEEHRLDVKNLLWDVKLSWDLKLSWNDKLSSDEEKLS